MIKSKTNKNGIERKKDNKWEEGKWGAQQIYFGVILQLRATVFSSGCKFFWVIHKPLLVLSLSPAVKEGREGGEREKHRKWIATLVNTPPSFLHPEYRGPSVSI